MIPRNKGLLLILDGLGDRPIEAFGGRTPLEAATTPNLEGRRRSAEGVVGIRAMEPAGYRSARGWRDQAGGRLSAEDG